MPSHASSREDGALERPGVRARPKEEAKGRHWWSSGQGCTLSLQGVRVRSLVQEPKSGKLQSSSQPKRKRRKKIHTGNARVCSSFDKNVQPLPNTCLKCLFDYFAFLPQNIKIMHGHLFTCSLRAPMKVATICTYAIELFNLKWIGWRQIKEEIRQLMHACVSRECLEQKQRISVFYFKIIFGLLFFNQQFP